MDGWIPVLFIAMCVYTTIRVLKKTLNPKNPIYIIIYNYLFVIMQGIVMVIVFLRMNWAKEVQRATGWVEGPPNDHHHGVLEGAPLQNASSSLTQELVHHRSINSVKSELEAAAAARQHTTDVS